ncbi:MAG: TonB-dependent receptor plug domain-containing protein [Puniceicoccaceae bacterium]
MNANSYIESAALKARNFVCALIGCVLVAPWTLTAQEATSEDDTEIYDLSPFVVDASDDTRYAATNTLAATRVRTDLNDVASSVSVYTKDFLEDVNATDDASLLLYATNAEVGGISGNFAGAGNGGLLDETAGFRAISTTTRVRGLDAADNTRDYFRTLIPWDGYNVDRVDMQRGPNSVLYGLGKPAGIINTTLKQPLFDDYFEMALQVSNWGSVRVTGDFNKEIIDNELAVRFNVLSDSTEFRQDPAYEDDERFYIAAKYLPEFLIPAGFALLTAGITCFYKIDRRMEEQLAETMKEMKRSGESLR